ncbi:hypothetical protein NQ317_000821 [Molorchus minor]|uniref:CCHC-type domain-containing protein n=1 Tax=Molorchus minor TaxID=1323400 RepID=A0ABQ9JED6_9CUCU|nr:hypothetical protein NQ317_000821 [Molorchus minor]
MVMAQVDFNATLVRELGPFTFGKMNWLEYQYKMENFFDEHEVWSEERKRDICLSMIGAKTLNILRSLVSPQNVRETDYSVIVSKLEAHFFPKLSRAQHIFKFKHQNQRISETFFEYVSILRKLVVNCRYNKIEDELKKQIVSGIRDEELKNKFIDDRNTSLSRIFELGLAHDDSKKLKRAPHPRNHKARINREKTCFRCKESIPKVHKNEACPFDWAVCEHCHVKGHISTACKYKNMSCNYCSEQGHIAKICLKNKENSKLRLN